MDASRATRAGPGHVRRFLRTVLWAVFFALVFGLVVGTLLRRELERPVRYIGERSSRNSILTAYPGNIGNALSRVLMSSHHEEQI